MHSSPTRPQTKTTPAAPSQFQSSNLQQVLNTANSSAASVPISVYRQLAAELQATQAMLDSVQLKNDQLTQQNQQLRDEIGQVAAAAQKLHQMANPIVAPVWGNVSTPASAKPAAPTEADWNALPDLGPVDTLFAAEPFAPEPLTTESVSQPAVQPERGKLSLANRPLMVVMAVAIAAAAFGVSYNVMRSLPQR
jgi:hypothetical protein